MTHIYIDEEPITWVITRLYKARQDRVNKEAADHGLKYDYFMGDEGVYYSPVSDEVYVLSNSMFKYGQPKPNMPWDIYKVFDLEYDLTGEGDMVLEKYVIVEADLREFIRIGDL